MAQSSSFATLIFASLLSCHSCTKRNSDDIDGEGRMVDSMLRGASIALVITFSVVTTLPPSSPALDRDFGLFVKSSAIPQASPNSSPESNDSCYSHSRVAVANFKVDRGDDGKVNEYPHSTSSIRIFPQEVDGMVRVWTLCKSSRWLALRIQLRSTVLNHVLICEFSYTCLRSRGSRNPLQLLHRTLQTIPEYDDVPAMTSCDSLMSISGDSSSISTLSSQDFSSLTSKRKTMKMSPQPNAEWGIIEYSSWCLSTYAIAEQISLSFVICGDRKESFILS
eukprot:CAMPEP_0172301828 /NCGR_PEP_ID=MMETSP1058-20130122/3653_1 /TAXON_ID=83371 /ORGANISM="Detonula confervacea, Strain CCMP 353" /LENGTH=278 /DNA_ID=CAMNT_0013012107 /DNA_START=15 /DNA_END=847 /DNA_ORIENTATION=-